MNGQVLYNWLKRIKPGQTFHTFPIRSWERICNALEGLRGEGGITVHKDPDGRNWTISLNSRTGDGGEEATPETAEIEILGGNKIDVTRAGDTWTISYDPDKPDESGSGSGSEDGGGDGDECSAADAEAFPSDIEGDYDGGGGTGGWVGKEDDWDQKPFPSDDTDDPAPEDSERFPSKTGPCW